MQLNDAFYSQLATEADLGEDCGERPGYVKVTGPVDVGALIGLVLAHAADVVIAARHLGTVARPGQSALPQDIAVELRRQAAAYGSHQL